MTKDIAKVSAVEGEVTSEADRLGWTLYEAQAYLEACMSEAEKLGMSDAIKGRIAVAIKAAEAINNEEQNQ